MYGKWDMGNGRGGSVWKVQLESNEPQKATPKFDLTLTDEVVVFTPMFQGWIFCS